MTLLVTDDSFQREVLDSGIPVVLCFWADWSPPCRTMNPVLEEVSAELKGQIRIAKIMSLDNQHVSYRFGIHAIPTFLIFKGGEHVSTHVGATTKSAFTNWIMAKI